MQSLAYLMSEEAARQAVPAVTDTPGVSSTGSWDFNAPMYADFSKICMLQSLYDDDSVDESYFSMKHTNTDTLLIQ